MWKSGGKKTCHRHYSFSGEVHKSPAGVLWFKKKKKNSRNKLKVTSRSNQPWVLGFGHCPDFQEKLHIFLARNERIGKHSSFKKSYPVSTEGGLNNCTEAAKPQDPEGTRVSALTAELLGLVQKFRPDPLSLCTPFLSSHPGQSGGACCHRWEKDAGDSHPRSNQKVSHGSTCGPNHASSTQEPLYV